MSLEKSRLNVRRAPRQHRSREMVDWILEAAARVLERDGLAGYNTNRVAELAGVSVGSVYQYFPNKDALVAALIARIQANQAQSLAELVDRLEGVPLIEALRAAVAFALEQQFGRPKLAKMLEQVSRRTPPLPAANQSEAAILAAVQRLLDRHRDELAPGLPDGAAADCLLLVRTLVDRHLADATPADLEARVVRVLLGYLTR